MPLRGCLRSSRNDHPTSATARPRHAPQATASAIEAWSKFGIGFSGPTFPNTGHFRALAAGRRAFGFLSAYSTAYSSNTVPVFG